MVEDAGERAQRAIRGPAVHAGGLLAGHMEDLNSYIQRSQKKVQDVSQFGSLVVMTAILLYCLVSALV